MVDLPRDDTTHSGLFPFTSINNNKKMPHGCTHGTVLATSRPWVLSLVPKNKTKKYTSQKQRNKWEGRKNKGRKRRLEG